MCFAQMLHMRESIRESGKMHNRKQFARYIILLFFYPVFSSLKVLKALITLVTCPEPEHPLRADLAEEYCKDRARFMKNAEEFTKKHSEKRPVE